MSTTTFPNGQTLTSSALTPDGVAAILQPLVARILCIDPDTQPDSAFRSVRVAWQQEGQPAWSITEDVCVIRAAPENDPYSQVRDDLAVPNDPTSLTRTSGFTQVWGVHFTLYGPNCYDRARLILSAVTLDWVHDALAACNLYAVPVWQRPVYAPELFQSQWWKRADLELKFNESVTESTAVSTATSVDVTILPDTDCPMDLHIVP